MIMWLELAGFRAIRVRVNGAILYSVQSFITEPPSQGVSRSSYSATSVDQTMVENVRALE